MIVEIPDRLKYSFIALLELSYQMVEEEKNLTQEEKEVLDIVKKLVDEEDERKKRNQPILKRLFPRKYEELR